MSTLKNRIGDILSDCVTAGDGELAKFYLKIMEEIDKEQKILRPALRWFAEEMETDLRRNDFKGGWLDGELGYYRGKALEHMIALEDIDSMKFEKMTKKKRAIEHCVKSANYMMMLAHNLIEELKER